MNNKKILSISIFSLFLLIFYTGIAFEIIYNSTLIGVYIVLGIFYALNLIVGFFILISKHRSTQTKACWLFTFLLLPLIGILLFLIFGTIPFSIKNKMDEDGFKNNLFKTYEDNTYSVKFIEKEKKWSSFKFNNGTSNAAIYKKNELEIVKNNCDILAKCISLIQRAKKTIIVQMYIIENGVFLYTIANELIKKSKDGVKVYFMYDWVGSFRKSNSKLIRLMIKKGIDVSVFNPRGFNPLKSSTNFRSHEKNLIIDNKTCLYGSFNIADQYLTIKKNANIFKDLSFIISGEIVNSMSINFFANYFQFSNAKKKNKQITEKNLKNILQVYQADNNLKMQFISSAPNYTIKNIEDSLMQTFLNAKKRIRIINPFFCPTSVVLRALNIAGQNNIDVEIMLPGKKSEKNWSLLMNRSFYSCLLRNNVKVYEYSTFVHAKCFIIDDDLSIFGSSNLDNRSLKINFENAIIAKDEKLNSNLNNYFDKMLGNSIMIDKQWIKKNIRIKNKIQQNILNVYKPLV